MKATSGSPLARLCSWAFAPVPTEDAPAKPYYPAGLVAGWVPRAPGREQEAAWAAARIACGTDTIALHWAVASERVYWIAAPARELAAQPHSWCPLAALLPGAEQAIPAPAIYEASGQTLLDGQWKVLGHAMIVEDDGTIEILAAPPSQLRPQIERYVRGRASPPAVLRVDASEGLDPVPWVAVGVSDERAVRRSLLMLAGAGTLAVAVLSAASIAALAIASVTKLDTAATRRANAQAAASLLEEARRLAVDPTRPVVTLFRDVDQRIARLQGWLVHYEVGPDGRVTWTAQFPAGVSGRAIEELGGVTTEVMDDGRILARNR